MGRQDRRAAPAAPPPSAQVVLPEAPLKPAPTSRRIGALEAQPQERLDVLAGHLDDRARTGWLDEGAVDKRNQPRHPRRRDQAHGYRRGGPAGGAPPLLRAPPHPPA